MVELDIQKVDAATQVDFKDLNITDEQSNDTVNNNEAATESSRKRYSKKKIAIGVGLTAVAGVTTFIAAPILIVGGLGVAGFGGGGIVAGSLAASIMSASATTGFGAAGVALAQSVGAAGIGLGAQVVMGAGGALAGTKFASWFTRSKNNDKSTQTPSTEKTT